VFEVVPDLREFTNLSRLGLYDNQIEWLKNPGSFLPDSIRELYLVRNVISQIDTVFYANLRNITKIGLTNTSDLANNTFYASSLKSIQFYTDSRVENHELELRNFHEITEDRANVFLSQFLDQSELSYSVRIENSSIDFGKLSTVT
jgi:Leucine-rich repeat (LRR) protein